MKFAAIPPGTFQMSNASGGNTHKVTISRPFWISRTCVSERELRALLPQRVGNEAVENIGKAFPGFDVAAGDVRYGDYEKICKKLNALYSHILPEGYMFGLPTEAELEYALRQGGTNEMVVVDTKALAKRECEGKGMDAVKGVSFLSRNEINGWGMLFGFAKGNYVYDSCNGRVCVFKDGRSTPRVPYAGPHAIDKNLA